VYHHATGAFQQQAAPQAVQYCSPNSCGSPVVHFAEQQPERMRAPISVVSFLRATGLRCAGQYCLRKDGFSQPLK